MTLTKKSTLIGVFTAAHFVLWLTVLGLIRLAGLYFLIGFYQWLCFPLVTFSAFTQVGYIVFLLIPLNSVIWGVALGLLVYAFRKKS